MKITFPHMGNMHIAIKALMAGLKLEVIPPPPVSKRTFELGIRHSPEFACMPLKINLGNFIEALENGADTIVMAGGWGPCRFGYYAQVERDILEGLGYQFKMIVLEAPDSKAYDLIKQIKALGENVSFWEAVKAIKYGWSKLNALELLERQFDYYLPRARDKHMVEKIYDDAVVTIDRAGSKTEADEATGQAIKKMSRVDLKAGLPLKIGIVGEIYTMFEPAANYNIYRLLGRMDVQVSRSAYVTEWINDHIMGGYVKKSSRKNLIACAKPYLNCEVGGHGLETVGNTVHFARMKHDGIIQIGPLTCMPEIVAQSIIPSISEKEGVPCMTLWFDELSGTAGLSTRLEAFVDMVHRKKLSTNNQIKEA
ncbi:MAG: CoA protein activase [Firmicutes bacterium HGW-Firmicutes-15]|nr:MAG: CoA protein activase [Firmicutes bacterium HGW-Firmicutes-15]